MTFSMYSNYMPLVVGEWYAGETSSSSIIEKLLKEGSEYQVLLLDLGFEGGDLGICLFTHSSPSSVYMSRLNSSDEISFIPLATSNSLIPVEGCVFSILSSEREYRIIKNLGELSTSTLQKAITMLKLGG